MQTSLINRNVVGVSGRTSIRLEPTFWKGLDIICEKRGKTRNEIVQMVQGKGHTGSLTTAIRAYILQHFMDMVNA